MARYFYGTLFFVLLAGLGLWTVSFYKTQPQVTASSSIAEFGGVSLNIDFATTTAGREKGLGDRESIPNDYGMLFVFPKDDYYGFWMKDTLVSLDMFWLDDKGQVVYVAQDVATSTYPNVFYPPTPARYVLETAAGFATAHGIATGTPLMLQNFPSVSE
jgi:uncharacterized membrane protein (UPF0127 family)